MFFSSNPEDEWAAFVAGRPRWRVHGQHAAGRLGRLPRGLRLRRRRPPAGSARSLDDRSNGSADGAGRYGFTNPDPPPESPTHRFSGAGSGLWITHRWFV